MTGTHTLHVGDVRETLAGLPAASVHCVVTSPPYWGLRSYGTNPQVWPVDIKQSRYCELQGGHEWGDEQSRVLRGSVGDKSTIDSDQDRGGSRLTETRNGAFCRQCGAWRGELGLEPTPDLYVQHLVEVFREVRRVLRDDGVLWLNLGDSYAAGPKDRTAEQVTNRSTLNGRKQTVGGILKQQSKVAPGLKPKDLCMIPARVAMALQADGWYLRAAMPWCKRNPMPDSTKDRPGAGVEMMYLLTKSPRYFYDHVAVRQRAFSSGGACFGKQDVQGARGAGAQSRQAEARERNVAPGQRSFRAADLFYSSIAPGSHGLISDDEGNPVALDVNTFAYSEAHFATFPPKLVEPLIMAGTSEKGCCPRCGAPWVREVEEKAAAERGSGNKERFVAAHEGERSRLNTHMGSSVPWSPTTAETTGWQPGCVCSDGLDELPDHPAGGGGTQVWRPAYPAPIPCTVLDPFAGSGTTLGIACLLGRDAIGIELQPDYAGQAERRIAAMLEPAGLFATGAAT